MLDDFPDFYKKLCFIKPCSPQRSSFTKISTKAAWTDFATPIAGGPEKNLIMKIWKTVHAITREPPCLSSLIILKFLRFPAIRDKQNAS